MSGQVFFAPAGTQPGGEGWEPLGYVEVDSLATNAGHPAHQFTEAQRRAELALWAIDPWFMPGSRPARALRPLNPWFRPLLHNGRKGRG